MSKLSNVYFFENFGNNLERYFKKFSEDKESELVPMMELYASYDISKLGLVRQYIIKGKDRRVVKFEDENIYVDENNAAYIYPIPPDNYDNPIWISSKEELEKSDTHIVVKLNENSSGFWVSFSDGFKAVLNKLIQEPIDILKKAYPDKSNEEIANLAREIVFTHYRFDNQPYSKEIEDCKELVDLIKANKDDLVERFHNLFHRKSIISIPGYRRIDRETYNKFRKDEIDDGHLSNFIFNINNSTGVLNQIFSNTKWSHLRNDKFTEEEEEICKASREFLAMVEDFIGVPLDSKCNWERIPQDKMNDYLFGKYIWYNNMMKLLITTYVQSLVFHENTEVIMLIDDPIRYLNEEDVGKMDKILEVYSCAKNIELYIE